jgi:hypothetical protein
LWKKLRGEKGVEAAHYWLDRLTLDEARATAAQTLEVVYDLVRHGKVVNDSSCAVRNFYRPFIYLIVVER